VAGFSPFIQYVIIVFMILSGMNFMLHILFRKGQLKQVISNGELRFYLKIIFFVGILLTLTLHFYRSLGWEQAFRDSFFQVTSVITATGFASADYLLWPSHAVLLIAFLMFIGACAGSTGGGVKVIRNLIVVKKIGQSFRQMINPNAVCEIRYNQKIIKPDHVASIITFVLIYYMVIAFGTLFLHLTGLDFVTSFGSAITTLGGIGPGFGTVGPVSNFAHLSDVAKIFLSFNMLTGRLEIYAVLVLLNPGFWKN
jgi:trk system potassium uptake protein TrkH